MPFAFRNQPLKGLYSTYQVLTTVFLRLPWWILCSLPRSWRPRQSWDLKRAIMVRLIRHSIHATAQTGPFVIKTPNYLAIEPDVGEYGVWVEPVPELVNAEFEVFARAVSVEPIRVPGYWMHKRGSDIKAASPPVPGEKVLYRLHGGGYTRCSAHPSDPTAKMSLDLVELTDTLHRAFAVEYRLSSTEPFPIAGQFPAALFDALAGYNYLVNVVGFSPSDIVVLGDSAGGNLAQALTRYLVENQNFIDHLPGPPGGLVLVSPWCDMSGSHVAPGSAVYLYKNIDILVFADADSYSERAFLGSHGYEAAASNGYISPSCKSLPVSFKGFPRTFIIAGGVELLLDQIRTIKARMVEDLGEGDGLREGEGKVRYVEEPDAVHDYPVFGWHEPEKSRTLREVAEWVDAAVS
ncbi:Alpha/Beta hydrolase fold [Amanita muscaria]